MKGKIVKINIFQKKGMPPLDVLQADCTLDCGLSSGKEEHKKDRQVTIIDNRYLTAVQEDAIKGLCYSRYKANLITENFDTALLNPQDILLCGDVVFQVTGAEKKCFSECPLIQNKQRCPLKKSAKFLQTKQGGILSVQQIIESKL